MHSEFHKPGVMKYYRLSFGKIMEDDNQDSDLIAQIMNEVLAVVAPSNTAISYSVYMVPCYDGDDDELSAYKIAESMYGTSEGS